MLELEHHSDLGRKLGLVGSRGATTEHLDSAANGGTAILTLALGNSLLRQVDLDGRMVI